MAVTLASVLSLVLDETSDMDLATRASKIRQTISMALSDGSGVDAANAHWSDTRNLNNTNETLDLSGSLTKPLGGTLALTKLKLLYIKNKSTTAGQTLVVGNATAPVLIFDAAADTHTIGPGGIFLVFEPSLAGITVTGTTADGLKLVSNADLNYDIVIVGVE